MTLSMNVRTHLHRIGYRYIIFDKVLNEGLVGYSLLATSPTLVINGLETTRKKEHISA
jgi:predicted DNA-binding transcriptional regulator